MNPNFILGLVHDDLKAFLTQNLPAGQAVGILDPKLLQVVKEEVGCQVQGRVNKQNITLFRISIK